MPYPHYFIKPTFAERVKIRLALEEFYKKGQYHRCKPLEAFLQSGHGITFDGISCSLKVTYRTVQMWFSRYRKYGLAGFLLVEKSFLRQDKPRNQARKIRASKKSRTRK
jgi:hypothetical protein